MESSGTREANPSARLYGLSPRGVLELHVRPGAKTVHEIFDDLPRGVYTGCRTFHHDRFLGLDLHLDRTERCMQLCGWSQRLERPALRRAIHQAVSSYPAADSFVRIDVLPGDAETDEELGGCRTFVSVSALRTVPEAFLREGVRIGFAPDLRREDPRIKKADFVIARRPYPLNRQEAYEHLLLDERGRILEATSANFHALVDGVVRTAGEGVLEGITQHFVLGLCGELEIPVRLEAVGVDELSRADEAFLTSSTRGVVPVVEVAGQRIGDARPGPRTMELLGAYRDLAEREARPAWPLPGE